MSLVNKSISSHLVCGVMGGKDNVLVGERKGFWSRNGFQISLSEVMENYFFKRLFLFN